MKSTLLTITLSTAVLSSLLSISHAADSSGFFINGNVGQSKLDADFFDDDDTAFGGNVGYRWLLAPSVLLGVEGGYTDLGKFKAEDSPSGIGAKLKGWNLGANGHFNMTDNWYVSGRAGWFRCDTDITTAFVGHFDDTSNGWYAGAGFGYDFNRNISLGLNYDHYKVDRNPGSDLSPNVVSISGEYRF
jgi:opacity protein-like surface antigen